MVTGLCRNSLAPECCYRALSGLYFSPFRAFSPDHRAHEPTSYSQKGSPNLCPGNSGPYLSPHCFTLTNEDMDTFACRNPCQDLEKRSSESAKLGPCLKLCRNYSLDLAAPRADFLSSRPAQLPLLPPTWTCY